MLFLEVCGPRTLLTPQVTILVPAADHPRGNIEVDGLSWTVDLAKLKSLGVDQYYLFVRMDYGRPELPPMRCGRRHRSGGAASHPGRHLAAVAGRSRTGTRGPRRSSTG